MEKKLLILNNLEMVSASYPGIRKREVCLPYLVSKENAGKSTKASSRFCTSCLLSAGAANCLTEATGGSQQLFSEVERMG